MGSWTRGATVVVTGASSGIGRAVACRLAAGGATVLAVARRQRELSALAAEFTTADGGSVVPVVGDVTDRTTPQRVHEAVERWSGHLDGLVNCAGLARFAALDHADLEDLDRMLAVNVRAPAALVQALLPGLRTAAGSVVNVTSIGGVVAMPGRALYGASKAAANSITRSLAHELAPGVRVNAVVPGAVDTPMYADLGLDVASTATLREGLLRTTPMGCFGRPEDVAGHVCTLLDPDLSGWVTGALVTVDGGRSA